jgi:malonyl-CoA/methylmalonyl-CoA synthetase
MQVNTIMVSENLYQLFATRFPEDLGSTFIETASGECCSYRHLANETARFARFLHTLGLSKGDRVAVQVEKSPQALMLYLACLRAGLIYLPLNTAYQADEIEYLLRDAEPAVMVVRPEAREIADALGKHAGVRVLFTLDAAGRGSFIDEAQPHAPEFPPVACSGDDIAALLYTSGTTGRPKGAMLSHQNLASNAQVLHRVWGFRAQDSLLHVLPLFHAHGLFVASHCTLLSGSKMVFLTRFEPRQAMDFLPRCTVFMGVPTYYTRLLAEPTFGAESCCSMRLFISGSAPLKPDTFADFQGRTGHRILERYGLTETLMNTSNPLEGTRKPGSVGPPLPGIRLRIVDEAGTSMAPGEVGEIQVQGPNVCKGYWRKPDKTAEAFTSDGFFRTGDLGSVDHEGYVAVVSRQKDLIITGGYNVYPKEVENVIDQLSGVQESAVIGLSDADFGEKVTAVVVRDADNDTLTAEMVITALKQRIANYKVPKAVVFVDALPRNAMGKVQKHILRQWFD